MFLPLTKDEVKQILKLLLKDVRKMLDKQNLKIMLSDSAIDLLADIGYEPQFGARPMKRVLQKEVINPLSKKLIAGSFNSGDLIMVDTNKEGLTFKIKKGSQEEIEEPVVQDI
jgi:ATP-dependent Clp protease ATP-binding subunit ClpB